MTTARRASITPKRSGLRRLVVATMTLGIALSSYLGVSAAEVNKAHTTAAVPFHIPTWAYDDGCSGGAGVRASVVRRWLSYGEANCGPHRTKVLSDCHANHAVYCKVMQYLDTDWNYPDGPVPTRTANRRNWWLHNPAPHQRQPVYSPYLGGGHLINQRKSDTRRFFQSYVRRYFNSFDGMLMDWQSPNLSMELYFSSCGCSRTAEIHSNADLRSGHQAMSASLTHRDGTPFLQFDNSFADNPNLEQGFMLLNHKIGVIGLMGEGVPEDYGQLASFYTTVLDEVAYIATKTDSSAMLLSRGDAGASYEPRSRRVVEATMLLGFVPDRLVDWSDLEHGKGHSLAVFPEAGIYPTGPVQSMAAPGGRGCLAGRGVVCSTGGHNSIRVASGVFRREFSACYNQGVEFGPCAAIVNTSGKAITVSPSWLRQTYAHRVTLIRGDVSAGGRINLTGASFTPGVTRIPAKDAILLAP